MQVAIDKTCLKYLDKVKGNELIYIFDNEPLEELLKLNMHCVHKSKINEVEVNASNYKLNAIKTVNLANISELELPKKKDYKFVVIIPNYNNDHGNIDGKTFLQKCIESVLNQTYKNFEIIVIDDMSIDTSVKTIEKYRKQDNRITLIKNIRKRYNGGSRNVGIEYAMNNLDFDYFAMLDSDDFFVDENVLQKINDNLWDCELMLLGCEMIFPDGTTQTKINEYDNYKDFFICDNKTWCTAHMHQNFSHLYSLLIIFYLLLDIFYLNAHMQEELQFFLLGLFLKILFASSMAHKHLLLYLYLHLYKLLKYQYLLVRR